MRTRIILTGFLTIFVILTFSCTPSKEESPQTAKLENTLKSVSFWIDTITVDPAALLASLERVNQAIDEIGYPDAGYKLWKIQGDTITEFKFMLEGYWPDQAIYDSIHNHALYIEAWDPDTALWNKLDAVLYHRFIRVK
ncbi:MAG: hypothetical protein AMS27_09810 [Bacteroides sp. SM23_62_1]|nr:MAG: hypothetical protein AMS27_09810 [Bacteroides sp. SM23_62_1]